MHLKSLSSLPDVPTRRGNACPSASSMPPTSGCAPAVVSLPKPMRPLNAYHIFFQIEREFIIQNIAIPNADESIHDNKCFMPDVPRRYRRTKLSPDWYAAPGKRRKRKHRKSHGKIGFHELSLAVARRWATLEMADPETKRYVSAIAASELAQYKAEMRQYKETTELAAAISASDSAPKANSEPAAPHRCATTAKVDAVVSPRASPTPSFAPKNATPAPSNLDHIQYCQPVQCEVKLCQPVKFEPIFQPIQREPTPCKPAQREPTLCQPVQFQPVLCQPVGCKPFFPMAESLVGADEIFKEEFDHSICNISSNGDCIAPSAPSQSERSYAVNPGPISDPLFDLEDILLLQQIVADMHC